MKETADWRIRLDTRVVPEDLSVREFFDAAMFVDDFGLSFRNSDGDLLAWFNSRHVVSFEIIR